MMLGALRINSQPRERTRLRRSVAPPIDVQALSDLAFLNDAVLTRTKRVGELVVLSFRQAWVYHY